MGEKRVLPMDLAALGQFANQPKKYREEPESSVLSPGQIRVVSQVGEALNNVPRYLKERNFSQVLKVVSDLDKKNG